MMEAPHRRRRSRRRWGERGWVWGGLPGLESPAFVAGFDDVAVEGEPVEQRGGHLGVTELAPIVHRRAAALPDAALRRARGCGHDLESQL